MTLLSAALVLTLLTSCASDQASDRKMQNQSETQTQTENIVVTVAGLERAKLSRVTTMNNGEPSLALSTERNVTLATTALTISTDASKTLMADSYATANGWPAVSSWFAAGGALMRSSTFEPIPRDFRAMETDFGVLPYPKLDENQDRYYTLPEHTSFMVAFPTTCNADMSGLIIEAMAAESTYTVKEAFYETCLNEKSVRDEESKKILDIIFDSKFFDIGYFLDFGGVRSQIQNLESSGKTDVASAFEKINKQAQKALDKFLDSYSD